jgi:galactose mutarotase-like enzyme
MSILENESIKIVVAAEGAELQSVYHKVYNLEYLWQGDKAVWPRKAPVLFPIVGKLKDNTYTYQGNTYTLPQHGFARDCMFTLVEATSLTCIYRLQHSATSLTIFPFEFELDIIYTIQETTLNIEYRVHNPSTNEELFFSIGAHPGFRCPLVEGEIFEDHYLEFESSEKLNRVLLNGGLRSDDTEEVFLKNNILPLSVDLFSTKDAIVVSNLNSERISLKSNKSKHGLHFNYQKYPWFGIWSKPGPFVCLEPWMGVADDVHSNKEFVNKEAIQSISPKSNVTYSYSITLF